MVRWRFVLFLAMMMLAHVSCSEDQDEEIQDVDDEENEDKDDDEEDTTEKFTQEIRMRASVSTVGLKLTRTTKQRPLECFVCSYKKDTPIRSCLDPSKYRVNTETCHNQYEKCFTAVETKGSVINMVTRGCRNSCVGTPDVTCCETNRCNDQKFSMPEIVMKVMSENKSSKSIQHSIVYFITILLLLQTVVKVNIL